MRHRESHSSEWINTVGFWIKFAVGFAFGFLVAHITRAETLNRTVTQDTIASTICIKGWTASVRPPFYETQRIKALLLKDAGLSWDDGRGFQLDHRIPLALGGHPLDPANLQLQPWPEARRKDRLEVQASRCVCAGVVSLAQARADLAGDWKTAYGKYARMTCRRPK